MSPDKRKKAAKERKISRAFKEKIENETLTKKEKFWTTTKRIYAIIAVIFTIIGWIARKNDIHKWFSSDREIYQEDNFIQGILLPDELLYSTNQIEIGYGTGTMAYPIEQFKKGIDFRPNMFVCMEDSQPPININFQIIRNRLYVTDTLRVLENEEIAGIMTLNNWALKKDNLLDYHSDDKKLEVIDRQGHIMFSLQFVYPNRVNLQGYFIKRKTAAVIFQQGFNPCIIKSESNWKEKVLEDVANIKSLF